MIGNRLGCATVAGIGLLLCGCGMLYELDVSAQKREAAVPGNTYVVLSSDPELPVTSARFEQFANQLERALDDRGYVRIANDRFADAALAIYLAADVGDPAKTYHTVSRAVYETPYPQDTRDAARSTSTPGGGQQGGSGSPPTILDRNPPLQISGVEKSAFATTVYTKHLTVLAIDLQRYLADIGKLGQERAVPQELWSLDVETTGTPADLDRVVPVMIAAGAPYFGQATDDDVRVRLSEGDRRIRDIRGERR